ncbi:MAG: hypothetical protein MJ189_01260 [Coriobacteriales bacterium]|nr:hypothetical protein [Coriobacteriales bacterium]
MDVYANSLLPTQQELLELDAPQYYDDFYSDDAYFNELRLHETKNGNLAPLISCVSASGGVGKSSLALISARLCAASGIDTVLVEGDLQFGDYGYWLGLDEDLPTLGDTTLEDPIQIAPNLHLYKAPLFPELAEKTSDNVSDKISLIRKKHSLVFADTGAFWNGFTANLLLESSLFYMVCDSRVSSILGAIKASELCTRIGVALSRMVIIYNKFNSRVKISQDDLKKTIGSKDIFTVSDGKSIIEEYISSSNLEELISIDNSTVRDIRSLLHEILPHLGLIYTDEPINTTSIFK